MTEAAVGDGTYLEAAGGQAEEHGLVIAIFGPTGVGKTEVASLVALELGVRVISCDSMQIYRAFPVLTNQPRQGAAAGEVVHELVGVAEAQEEWSAALYGRRAQALIDADIASTGWAVIAGGTGLYMRSALAPLAMSAAFDPERRAALERLAAAEGPQRLHERLAAADPETAQKIHPHNVRRVVRALEVIETEGASILSERRDLWQPEYRHPTLQIVLTAARAELYERIEHRAREMVAGGAVEEVRRHRALRAASLHSPAPETPPAECAEPGGTAVKGAAERSAPGSAAPGTVAAGGAPARTAPEIPPTPPRGIERAIGYRELTAHLDGETSLDEATAELAAATRRYVRRQTTWLRRLKDAVIIDTSGREPGEISAQVLQTALATRGRRRTPGS